MRAVVAGVLCAVAVTVGCSVDRAGDTVGAPSTTTTPAATSSGIPAPPSIDEWVTTTDSDSGVSFALPAEPTRHERPGDDGASGTLYQAEVTENVNLAVTFSRVPGADYSAAGLADMADQFVDQFQSQETGVDDLQVLDRRAREIYRHPVLDFRVSFTSTKGSRSVWFVRYVGNGSEAVQLQSLAFAEPAEEAEVTQALRLYHQQLVGSLYIPRR